MDPARASWRWLARGLGGYRGLLENCLQSHPAGPGPDELKRLRKNLAEITQFIEDLPEPPTDH